MRALAHTGVGPRGLSQGLQPDPSRARSFRRPSGGPRVRRACHGTVPAPLRPRALPPSQSLRRALPRAGGAGGARRRAVLRGRPGPPSARCSPPSLPRASCTQGVVAAAATAAAAASSAPARSHCWCHGGPQQVLDGAELLGGGRGAPAALPAAQAAPRSRPARVRLVARRLPGPSGAPSPRRPEHESWCPAGSMSECPRGACCPGRPASQRACRATSFHPREREILCCAREQNWDPDPRLWLLVSGGRRGSGVLPPLS